MKRFIAVSVLLLSFTGSASATPFTNIFNFGDSFSDTGNVTTATTGSIPGVAGGLPLPPYAEGRFTSNFTNGDAGVVFYDIIASKLGFSSKNSLNGGNNYAFGGARTGPLAFSFPFSLLDQTQMFLVDVGGIADPHALYSVFGGGNDIRDNFLGGSAQNSVANIIKVITDLHSAGAKNFFLPNQPNIGLTPESLAGAAPGGTALDITAASLLFNMELQSELQLLEANLDVNIIKFDLFSLFNDVVSTPQDFGFTNATQACYDGDLGIGGPGNLCDRPDDYLFFDGIHPTAAAHTLLGNLAFASIISAIPTPATLALLLSGLAILGFRRKKA